MHRAALKRDWPPTRWGRRLLAAWLLCVATLPLRAMDLRAAADATLQRGLVEAIQAIGLEAAVQRQQLAVALVDLRRPGAARLAMVNGDHMMYAASLPKVGILVGALAEAEAGHLVLDEERLRSMHEMIRWSSNAEATRVLGWVGGERLLEILQSERFRFYDPATGGGLWVGKAYGKSAAFRRDPLHNLSHGATAYQVARLYAMLAEGQLFTPRYTALAREILGEPAIPHKFVRALQDQPGVHLYRKSGTWRDWHADSALVEQGDTRYVIVALAEHPSGGEWLVRLAARLHGLLAAPAPAAPR